MSTICVILAVLILTLVLMTGQYNDSLLNINIMFTDKSYQISFLVMCLVCYALGVLSCSLLMLSQFFDANGKYSRLKKQYEKTNINADDAQEKIKLLENKIQTLEAALKKQLDKN